MKSSRRFALVVLWSLCLAPLAVRAQGEEEEAEVDTSEIDELMQRSTGVSTTAVPDSGSEVKAGGDGQTTQSPVVLRMGGEGLPTQDVNDGAFTGDEPRFAEFGCPAKGDDLGRSYVICADAARGRIQHSAIFPSTGAVVLPNRSFVIRVLHPADERISVSFTGTRGIYTPTLRTDGLTGARGGPGGKRDVKWVVSQWTLPPVMPPSAIIRLDLRDRTNALLDSVTFDLVVEPTYMGALRVGIAAVGLGATNAEYTVVRAPGTTQGQITGLPPAAANFELVIGYAPYLERGGRPVSGCRGGLSCFAPYLGIGVLAQNNKGLDFFESLHLGVEWEPVPSFSIALTGVARRVDRLKPGLRVGGPANDNDVLTTQRITFGAGVVFNVSPQFLKVAHAGGGVL